MKRHVLLLLLCLMLPAGAWAGTKWTIKPGGGGNYATLQAAITALSAYSQATWNAAGGYELEVHAGDFKTATISLASCTPTAAAPLLIYAHSSAWPDWTTTATQGAYCNVDANTNYDSSMGFCVGIGIKEAYTMVRGLRVNMTNTADPNYKSVVGICIYPFDGSGFTARAEANCTVDSCLVNFFGEMDNTMGINVKSALSSNSGTDSNKISTGHLITNNVVIGQNQTGKTSLYGILFECYAGGHYFTTIRNWLNVKCYNNTVINVGKDAGVRNWGLGFIARTELACNRNVTPGETDANRMFGQSRPFFPSHASIGGGLSPSTYLNKVYYKTLDGPAPNNQWYLFESNNYVGKWVIAGGTSVSDADNNGTKDANAWWSASAGVGAFDANGNSGGPLWVADTSPINKAYLVVEDCRNNLVLRNATSSQECFYEIIVENSGDANAAYAASEVTITYAQMGYNFTTDTIPANLAGAGDANAKVLTNCVYSATNPRPLKKTAALGGARGGGVAIPAIPIDARTRTRPDPPTCGALEPWGGGRMMTGMGG